MPSTYVARNASVAVVSDEPKAQVWDMPQAPTSPSPRPEPVDDLGSARGIFTAVVAGAGIWLLIGWGIYSLIERLTS